MEESQAPAAAATAEPNAAATPSDAPPAYDGAETTTVIIPPAYDVATKLPSYDEAEKSKATEAALSEEQPCPDRAARQARRARRHAFSFLWGPPVMMMPEDSEGSGTLTHAQLQQQVLGTELEFLCCFLVALLFNWIGLFAALCCLTVTIAGRAGAISGFGLSVVKWAFLVMHQSYITRATFGMNTTEGPLDFLGNTTDDSLSLKDNKWFTVSCWLIVGLGFLCFLQGILHYVRAKRCARDYNWLRQRYQAHPF